MGLDYFFTSISQGQNESVCRDAFLSEAFRGECVSKNVQIFARNQLHKDARTPISCWLVPSGHYRLPEPACIASLQAPILHLQWESSNFNFPLFLFHLLHLSLTLLDSFSDVKAQCG